MKTRKNPITLRAKPPNGLLLNKPLIIMVSLFIVLFLFWGIFYAFRTPKKTSMDKSKAVPANFQTVENSTLASLPSNYQDIRGITYFLQQHTNTNHQNTKNKASSSTRKQSPQVKNPFNPNNKDISAALQSGVFFNGLTPKKQTNAFSNSNKTTSSTNQSSPKTEKGGESSYEKQNMQSQKLKFLQQKDDSSSVYNTHALIKPISAYEVQAGAIIPAVIITAINTSLPGMVVAQVSQDVYDSVTGKTLLIPKGSKIVGKYDSRIAYGQTRVLIAFNRIIMPNGSSIELNNFNGSDMAGTAGFDGNVNNHWMRVLGAATISTLLSVGTGVASTDAYYNSNNYYPSPMQNALSAAGGNMASTGQQITSKAMNIQPTITVPAGFEFNVMVNKDMILEPYQVRHATI